MGGITAANDEHRRVGGGGLIVRRSEGRVTAGGEAEGGHALYSGELGIIDNDVLVVIGSEASCVGSRGRS